MYVDTSKTPQQRDFHSQQAQYYRLTVNYNDANISSALAFGALPQYAYVTDISGHVETAFNAATSNLVTIGTTASPANEIVAGTGAASVAFAPGTTGFALLTAAAGLGITVTSSGAATLYVKYVQSGTAATAGKIHIVMRYVLNNDY
jgi:hypothetical protein